LPFFARRGDRRVFRDSKEAQFFLSNHLRPRVLDTVFLDFTDLGKKPLPG
jgi:hypothetical protein